MCTSEPGTQKRLCPNLCSYSYHAAVKWWLTHPAATPPRSLSQPHPKIVAASEAIVSSLSACSSPDVDSA
jgi:hypothetical protein